MKILSHNKPPPCLTGWCHWCIYTFHLLIILISNVYVQTSAIHKKQFLLSYPRAVQRDSHRFATWGKIKKTIWGLSQGKKNISCQWHVSTKDSEN